MKFSKLKKINIFYIFYIFFLILNFNNNIFSQDLSLDGISVSGIVQDESNNPVVDANVTMYDVKGEAIFKTITKADGKFVFRDFKQGDGYYFVITKSGFIEKKLNNYSFKNGEKISIIVDIKKDINIKTNNVEEKKTDKSINENIDSNSKIQEEVIVVGYGTQKKGNVSTAVVQTKGEELAKEPVASLSQTFQGRMSGVYATQASGVPGYDDAKVFVRGINSFNSPGALIVIDGVASADPDGINRLDANMIESITVLKDASAAIYGAQSAGGVILVTTKRGFISKPKLEINTSSGWQTPTQKVIAANANQFVNVVNGTNLLNDPNSKLLKAGTSYDWWDALITPVFNGKYSATLTGGTEKIRYFLGGGLANQYGIIYGDDKTKLLQYNARANVDIKDVFEGLDMGFDINFRNKYTGQPQSDQLGGGVIFATQTDPQIQPFINNNQSLPSYGWSGYNPAAIVKYPGFIQSNLNLYDFRYSFKYNIKQIKGLSLEGFASVIKTVRDSSRFIMPGVYYSKDSAGNILTNSARNTTGQTGLTNAYDQSLRTTYNIRFNYKTTINDNHNIDAFIAYEQSNYSISNFWTTRLGHISPDIQTIDAGFTGTGNLYNGGTNLTIARQNIFGRFNYDFKGKYLFTAIARYDGSSRFASGNQWGFFPGVSAGWVISKEDFMQNNTVISNLKLKASYGRLGNDNIAPYQYTPTFNYGIGYTYQGADVKTLAAAVAANPNITWETSDNLNIGFELGVLKNKLKLDFDYFYVNSFNILTNAKSDIPSYIGLSLPYQNIGQMTNKGVDLTISWNEKINSNFKYGITGNLSYNVNSVVSISETPGSLPNQLQAGHPFGSVLVYKSVGIYKSQAEVDADKSAYSGAKAGYFKFADLNGDGKVDANDRYRYDINLVAPLQFGLNLNCEYKGIDFNMLFTGQQGADFVLNNAMNVSVNNIEYVAKNNYTIYNTNSLLPRGDLVGVGASDVDFWHTKKFWIRLKSINLGYSFLPFLSELKKANISKLRVFVSFSNLALLYNNISQYSTKDPELANGQDYPIMFTSNFGINITF